MGKYFGTDGFRGEANVNLTVDHARKVGRFLGWYYGQLKKQRGDDIPAKVVIGKDTRRSSYMFEYSFKGMKVGLDCANGSSWNMAQQIFDSLGAKTFVINAEPDGTNINRDAGSTHIEGLQKYVVENGLDVGFAYDGDADRCLCVDEKGNVVDGDAILYVVLKYIT